MGKRIGCVWIPPAPPAVISIIAAVVMALLLTGVI